MRVFFTVRKHHSLKSKVLRHLLKIIQDWNNMRMNDDKSSAYVIAGALYSRERGLCFYDTFEQSEEESLRVCDRNSAFLIGAGFGLELFVVIFVEEAEGVWHAYGVALMKSFVVLAEMFGAHAQLLILLLSSWWTTQTVNIYKEFSNITRVRHKMSPLTCFNL